jgi:hypothetical protein
VVSKNTVVIAVVAIATVTVAATVTATEAAIVTATEVDLATEAAVDTNAATVMVRSVRNAKISDRLARI